MTALLIFAWLASIAFTVAYMSRVSRMAVDASEAALADATDTTVRQRNHIADLTDRLALAEMDRDEAIAALNARIARRSEASKRAAETRRARAVLIEPPALAVLASDAEGAE